MKWSNLYVVMIGAFLFSTLPGCDDTETVVASETKFDRKAWLSAKGESARKRMVKALEKELKLGMTTEEIIELMGKPDSKIDTESEKSYIYGLGRGLIDYDEYRIIFDDAWKVSKFLKLQG